MALSKSTGLEEPKQAGFLTEAEDIGLCWTELYSAEKNPDDLLAEFLFLKLKAYKEACYVKQIKVVLLSWWAVDVAVGEYLCLGDLEGPQDLTERNLKNNDLVQTPYFIDEKLRAINRRTDKWSKMTWDLIVSHWPENQL